MRLLIDLQACQNGSRGRGIGRYALSLVKGMCRTAQGHEVLVLLNSLFAGTIDDVRRDLKGFVDDARILCFHVPGPVDELRPENEARRQAAEWVREGFIAELKPDAVLVASMVEGSMDDTVSSVGHIDSGAVVGAILYDLIPLIDPERYIGWPPAAKWYHDKIDSLRRCDLLLCISDSAAGEAVDRLGVEAARIVPISTAADEKFVGVSLPNSRLRTVCARFGIERRYLMHSGNVEPRKNFDGLIRAYAALPEALRSGYQLVLAGQMSGEGGKQLAAESARCGLAPDDVVMTGRVTDDELMALYAGCHLFVFPSLHEGFGLPALEAMEFGVPTIGSNTTSVPEVIGRADACFDPSSTPAIAAAMHRCLTDADFYASLKAHARTQARRFDWNVIAQRAWSAFEQALARRSANGAPAGRALPGHRRLMNSQLVSPRGCPPPDDAALTALAHCMALNDAVLIRSRTRVAAGANALNWRIEGPFDSAYSLALVNRESARALQQLGHHVALHSTEGPGDFPADPQFLAKHTDLRAMHERELRLPAEAADVQARNLYPPRVADMKATRRILHQYAWEESGFPAAWVADFNRHLHGITCTSTHVKKVLQDNGVMAPIAVVGNGVDHWERVVPASGMSLPGRRFRLLHVSSCFPRKGVDVLLAAFGDAFSDADEVSLIIKTFANPHNTVHHQLSDLRAANPRFGDVHVIEDALNDAQMKALYEHCHVLVAPSRAEGFGLPLAEALLCGLPVITTDWSGQLDFCNRRNAWLVDWSHAPAQTHFDIAGSLWAQPQRASLADAMRRASASSAPQREEMGAAGRCMLLEHYRWLDVAARSVDALRGFDSAAAVPVHQRKVGWITTWNTKCGIASYSRHLVEAAGDEVAVLAPRQSGLVRRDEQFVKRCWLSSKEENAFGELALCIDDARLEVLIVQFNYGFYRLEPFGEFLLGQIDAGRAVVVMMHATADPPALAEWDANWRLATLSAALRRCHRVLVHSVGDMNRLKAAGHVRNVSLFPHPLWRLPADGVAPAPRGGVQTVATFGYCLPGKGLAEVIDAVGLLHRKSSSVRLLMLNAQYPEPVSAALVTELRERIAASGIAAAIDFRADYLTDGAAAALLSGADLIVFAYQDTHESASGAVRHGLATHRPVLVTPISIFDDLGPAVFRAPGTDAKSVAAGIEAALSSLRADDGFAREVKGAAARWREAHDVVPLARRLHDMARAVWEPSEPLLYRFAGSSRALRTAIGRPLGETLVSTGQAGHLVFGPYVSLPPGRYRVTVTWRYHIPRSAKCEWRAVVEQGRRELARFDATGSLPSDEQTVFDVVLEHGCGDFEMSLIVDATVQVTLISVVIEPAVPAPPPVPRL